MAYQTVFDATQTPHDWSFIGFAILLVVVGVVLWTIRHKIKWRSGPLSAVFYVLFLCVWTTLAVLTFIRENAAADILSSGQSSEVEGVVTDFVPEPAAGHAREHFTVNGIAFNYGSYTVTSGFHLTAPRGGPIHNGLQVRIHYAPSIMGDPSDPIILKLEIRSNP